MIATQDCLRKRLQYILHSGFVEIRNLALGGKHEQIAELADAMEILPRYLDECGDEDQEMVRFILQNYESKFPQSTYRYLDVFDGRRDTPGWY